MKMTKGYGLFLGVLIFGTMPLAHAHRYPETGACAKEFVKSFDASEISKPCNVSRYTLALIEDSFTVASTSFEILDSLSAPRSMPAAIFRPIKGAAGLAANAITLAPQQIVSAVRNIFGWRAG